MYSWVMKCLVPETGEIPCETQLKASQDLTAYSNSNAEGLSLGT